jgi:multidrug efflux system membrane fusion protein
MRTFWQLGILMAAAVAASPLGCSKSSAKPEGKGGNAKGGRGAMTFPVEVAPVEARRVEYVVTAVGSVDAFEQVQVTARVAGAVEGVKFAEGDVVKKGAPLVEIELRRYQLAARSAEASLKRARAAKADAEATLARREKGVSEGIATAEDLQTARTRMETAAADLMGAEAAYSLAQLNLRDAYVRSPIDGTILTRTVTTGQYVSPGAVLATLVQRDPLLLRFQVAEHEAVGLKVDMTVTFAVRGMPGNALSAKVTSIADLADARTRMVQVVAHVKDPPAELRPGAFAEVTAPVGSAEAAPVVPQTAVRPSDRGFLSYVVMDGKAQERVLKLGMRTADGLVEVKSGVAAGEMVVVRGAEALTDGATVKVGAPGGKSSAAPAAGSAAPAPSADKAEPRR